MILCREKIDPAAGVKSLRFNRRRQGRIDENVIRSNMFRLIMESGLLIDQDLDEGLEQSFSAFFDVVNKLEEP